MEPYGRQLWAIAGSRRGVGKSTLAATMGLVLARMGKSVILVGADPVNPNLHRLLGIDDPVPGARDFIEGRLEAEAVLLDSPEPGLRFLSCCGAYLESTSLLFGRKEKVIKAIAALPADYILVEGSSERSDRNLDLFNSAMRLMLVATPEPAVVQDAYGFLRAALLRCIQRKFGAAPAVAVALRQLRESPSPRTIGDLHDALASADPENARKLASLLDDYRPSLILNRADGEQDCRVAEILKTVCRKLLSIDLATAGAVFDDAALGAAMSRMRLQEAANSPACGQVSRLVGEMVLNQGSGTASETSAAVIGLNDNLEFLGRVLHIQTEDLGEGLRAITTHVFCGGRVLFGRRTEYSTDVRGSEGRKWVAELMRKQHFEVLQELENKKAEMPRSS